MNLQFSYKTHTIGPQQSIINNGITNVLMGSPFKPSMMIQGGTLSNMRQIFNNNIKDNPGKRLASQDSSQHIYFKKLNSMSKSVNNKLSSTTEISYKSVDSNLPNQQLRKCRSGGSVAPKIKGFVR